MTTCRIPLLSSWNTPAVSPFDSSSNVFASSNGIASRSIFSPPPRAISSTAFFITVSVRSPSTSNFSRPTSVTASLSNCVVSPSPSVERCSGTTPFSGSFEITTPAAWVEACRASPSSPIAVSSRLRTV